jgi:hypothetical protein
MIESARRLIDQKLGSIGVWISLAALMLLGALLLGAGQSPDFVTLMAVFIVTAGVVSRDAASGALQMILARPILRAEYLFGRYLAAVGLVAGFLFAIFSTAVLIDRAASLAGWNAMEQSFSWREGLLLCAAELPKAALDAAILLFFSTFLRGMGDVLAFLLCGLVLKLTPQIAHMARKPGLARAGQVLFENVAPDGAWSGIVRGERVFQTATGQWALALAAYLLLAALIFDRREFSYGQD